MAKIKSEKPWGQPAGTSGAGGIKPRKKASKGRKIKAGRKNKRR